MIKDGNSMVIEKVLLNFGFNKKQIVKLGEDHYFKYLNPCFLIEVIYEYRRCLRINIYNKTDIINSTYQICRKVISEDMLNNMVDCEALRYTIENFVLKVIRSILQGELNDEVKSY